MSPHIIFPEVAWFFSSVIQFSSVPSLSHVQLFATPWTTACQASLSITTPGVHPNPCPLSRWCHPTISFSVVSFSSCPQSFPASGSFPVSQLFASGGQSTGVSASTSVLPMNTQDWSPLGLTGWISLQSRGSQESSPTPQFKSIRYIMTPHVVFGEGNGNPLQCSCLENPRDGEAWWASVYGVAQSQTQLKRLSSSSKDHGGGQDVI